MTIVKLTKGGNSIISFDQQIRTQDCKKLLSVSRSFVRAGTSFDLTRSQSGRTKHVSPSCVYANWYCGPVIQLKFSIFSQKIQFT